MKKEVEIKLGQEVIWGRKNEKKTGIVIAFVGREKNIFEILHKETGEKKLKYLSQSRIKFGGIYSQNDRYLIAVKRPTGSGIIDYYAPSAGMIKSCKNRSEGVPK